MWTHDCAVKRFLPASKARLSSWRKCRKEIDKDVSRLVESSDECERPQSAPPQFADAVSSGLPRVRHGRASQLALRLGGGVPQRPVFMTSTVMGCRISICVDCHEDQPWGFRGALNR